MSKPENTKSVLSEDLLHTPLFRIVSVLAIVCLAIPIVVSFFSPINSDSAIILVEMERIAEGFVPYQTLHLNYPPLWFYLSVAIKSIFHIPYGAYHFYLCVHWLTIIGAAACVGYIAKKINGKTTVALFTACLFLLAIERLQGNVLYLDQPAIFYGLLGLALTFRFENSNSLCFLLVGVITCLSFLTKQYGLGFAALAMWWIVTTPYEHRWRKSIMFVLGYCVPLAIVYVIWGNSIIQSTLMNGYGMEEMNEAIGVSITPWTHLMSILKRLLIFVVSIAPTTIAGIIFLPLSIRQRHTRESFLCLFGILGFALTFIFSIYCYLYYMYLVAFAILFIPTLLSLTVNKRSYHIIQACIAITALWLLFSTYRNRVIKVIINDGWKEYAKQWENGKKIAELTDGATVFIPQAECAYAYYTGNLRTANPYTFGYANGSLEISQEMATKQIATSDFVLHYENTDKIPDYYFYNEKIKSRVNACPADTIAPDLLLYDLRQRH